MHSRNEERRLPKALLGRAVQADTRPSDVGHTGSGSANNGMKTTHSPGFALVSPFPSAGQSLLASHSLLWSSVASSREAAQVCSELVPDAYTHLLGLL